MRYSHYRFSITTFGLGVFLSINALLQEDSSNLVWMLIGGLIAMLLGAFKYWIAKQTDPDIVDILGGIAAKKPKNKLPK